MLSKIPSPKKPIGNSPETVREPSKGDAVVLDELNSNTVPLHLREWVETRLAGRIVDSSTALGGNRCLGWGLTLSLQRGGSMHVFLRYQPFGTNGVEPYSVRREAEIYAALEGRGIPLPRLILSHPEEFAIVTDFVRGSVRYRDVADAGEQQHIALDFARALASLHQLDPGTLHLPGFEPATASMRTAVTEELSVWEAMYREVGIDDPHVEFALIWLRANLPDLDGRAALVHGDAGPGNFMFESGRLTALIDWELAHLGDPMEDLAWLSFRSVMEPIPDVPALLRGYSEAGGPPIDRHRILYHRVFVSLRIVIIRLRNLSGEPGNSIVSNALNRRLLVEAIVDAEGWAIPVPPPVTAEPTGQTRLYEAVIDDLRHVIVPLSQRGEVIGAAKNAAKTLKYLRDRDRYGPALDAREQDVLAALLPIANLTPQNRQSMFADAIRRGEIDGRPALVALTTMSAAETQMAASAMGRLAERRFPPLVE